MGRLQKKKTVSQKDKKKKKADSLVTRSEETVSEDNVVSFAPQAKDTKKKSVLSPKKSASPKAVTGSGEQEDGKIARFAQFLREVKVELKKVTWPAQKQTMASTVVVIVLVIILALFLGFVDTGLSNLVKLVL